MKTRSLVVSYPAAIGPSGIVNIKDASCGPWNCPSCAALFVAKRGAERAWHFAHKADSPLCTSEGVLHETCKLAIAAAFNQAKANGSAYYLRYNCEGCEQQRQMDLASHFDLAVVEKELLDGRVRPDIYLQGGNGNPSLVIEVVVTHAPDAGTVAAYREADILAFEVAPDWKDAEGWQSGISASAVIHVKNRLCLKCVDAAQVAGKRQNLIRDRLAQLASHVNRPSFEPWRDSRYGAPRIGRIAHNQLQAEGLCRAGFHQTKPVWVFSLELLEGVVFADLGGPESAFWPTALIYVQGFSDEGLVLGMVRSHLAKYGVKVAGQVDPGGFLDE